MKIIFIENRYATLIYSGVAKFLKHKNIDIHWIVQNPVFSPPLENVHVIPFPSKNDLVFPSEEKYYWLMRSDRGYLHFGGDGAHYSYYDKIISEKINEIKPDYVFGEATEFHELLAIKFCKQNGIKYYSPNVTRYPTDRVIFFLYDSLDAVGGENCKISNSELERSLDGIKNRKIIPSYMRKNNKSKKHIYIKIKDKFKILQGWILGEKYITPSPIKKFVLDNNKKKQIKEWDRYAIKNMEKWNNIVKNKKPCVLYALQMQPEGNIDVWGYPWNNQVDIIRRAANALSAVNAFLIVKPNPKSKYEMSEELNYVVKKIPNVVALPHNVAMEDVFPCVDMVLTVTGTILMESIFSNKPVAVLGDHAMSKYSGVINLSSPEYVADAFEGVVRDDCKNASSVDGINLLKKMYNCSYPAIIWDPVLSPEKSTDTNFSRLSDAFLSVMNIN